MNIPDTPSAHTMMLPDTRKVLAVEILYKEMFYQEAGWLVYTKEPHFLGFVAGWEDDDLYDLFPEAVIMLEIQVGPGMISRVKEKHLITKGF